MSAVWKHTDLRGTELLILLGLADHANDDGYCWPSYAKIAAKARTSTRWAMRCVKKLESQGYLIREHRGNVGRSNVYRIPTPKAKLGGEQNSTPHVEGVNKTAPLPCRSTTPPRGLEFTPGVVPSSHESSDESSGNHKGRVGAISFEEIHLHITANSSVNEIAAVALAERWLKDAEPNSSDDWKAELNLWLLKSA